MRNEIINSIVVALEIAFAGHNREPESEPQVEEPDSVLQPAVIRIES